MTAAEVDAARRRAREYLERAGIVLTPSEAASIEVADFGLSELEQTGLAIVTYVNTERCCAKELVLFPRQTCPQHRHPVVGGDLGKEETFRCRMGSAFLYVEGEISRSPRCRPPAGREAWYTVWHEVSLGPGEQYTIAPGTWHWFQAGDDGAVISEFSTHSTDEHDVFSDPSIARETKVAGSTEVQ